MTVTSELSIALPLEILIPATPVSQQGSPARKQQWQDMIKRRVSEQEPEGCQSHTGPIDVVILYFPPGRMQGDIDNIVKPILDAMCRQVYIDDGQVVSVFVKKFEPDRLVDIDGPTATLEAAINHKPPVLYISVRHSEG